MNMFVHVLYFVLNQLPLSLMWAGNEEHNQNHPKKKYALFLCVGSSKIAIKKSIEPEALPCSFGDGAECHWLFDLGERHQHHQAGERREARVAGVVVGKIIVGVLAVELSYKEKKEKKSITKRNVLLRQDLHWLH